MNDNNTFSRRTFVKGGVALVAAAGASRASAQQHEVVLRPEGGPAIRGTWTPTTKSLFCDVETTSGKVRGIDVGGIKQFKGVPYGASTGGKNRFMPPQKPEPWTGVRDCLAHGQIAPQLPADPKRDYPRLIQWDEQPGGMGEDCLVLNVCTPSVNDGKKRPVLVSFHGGGYTAGSNNASAFYGDPLARYGDVVVVTPNHRLAAFGFTHLVGAGAPEEFASAGVAGLLDLVAALQWVRDNISNFGGDPNTVMIFGQSGGGAKTTAMMGMPGAKGLFHRAAVQSGSLRKVLEQDAASKLAERFVAACGLNKGNIADMQKLPWEQLLDAQVAMGTAANFGPVLDGKAIPHHPFDPAAPEESATVPMIVSSTLEDTGVWLSNFNLTEDGLKGVVKGQFKDDADRILALYRKMYPDKSPFLVQAQIMTDVIFRREAIKQAELKAQQGKAPAYMYFWEWPCPAFGGKFGAVHGTDVGMAFHNARGSMYGESLEAQKMADRLASAWVAFARTGDPNNPEIPKWAPYDLEKRPEMVFDTDTRAENDHRGEIRKLWEEINPPSMVG